MPDSMLTSNKYIILSHKYLGNIYNVAILYACDKINFEYIYDMSVFINKVFKIKSVPLLPNIRRSPVIVFIMYTFASVSLDVTPFNTFSAFFN